MAVYFAPSVVPSEWNSVHQPIPFVLEFEAQNLVEVTDSGGFAQFKIVDYIFDSPAIGQRIYVPSGTYLGFHTITSLSALPGYIVILTDTVFTVDQSGVNVSAIIEIPEFSLYAGYDTGEAYETELPLELIATFTPEVSPQADIRFDVAGYLKSIFTIQAPTLGIDFSLFNRFRIRYDGHGSGYSGGFFFDPFYQVLNSSIPTAELMSTYFGTGVYLSSAGTQIIFGCGKTILSLLDITGVVVNTEVENGDTGADYFYDDYNEDDYLTQIST